MKLWLLIFLMVGSHAVCLEAMKCKTERKKASQHTTVGATAIGLDNDLKLANQCLKIVTAMQDSATKAFDEIKTIESQAIRGPGLNRPGDVGRIKHTLCVDMRKQYCKFKLQVSKIGNTEVQERLLAMGKQLYGKLYGEDDGGKEEIDTE